MNAVSPERPSKFNIGDRYGLNDPGYLKLFQRGSETNYAHSIGPGITETIT